MLLLLLLFLLLLLSLLRLQLSLNDHRAQSTFFGRIYPITVRDRMKSNKTQYPLGCS